MLIGEEKYENLSGVTKKIIYNMIFKERFATHTAAETFSNIISMSNFLHRQLSFASYKSIIYNYFSALVNIQPPLISL